MYFRDMAILVTESEILPVQVEFLVSQFFYFLFLNLSFHTQISKKIKIKTLRFDLVFLLFPLPSLRFSFSSSDPHFSVMFFLSFYHSHRRCSLYATHGLSHTTSLCRSKAPTWPLPSFLNLVMLLHQSQHHYR